MTEAKILQCHIWLVDSEPPIWRRFRVSDQMLLASLHPVLQVVMGWQNSHLHAFKIGDIFYANPAPVPQEETHDSTSQKLANFQFSAGSQFLYNYDFGDGWLHQITVEQVLPLEAEAPSLNCIEGKRACPPEDCGGIWGYEELLERLEDPEDPEYEELLDWVGADFDPEAFNVNAVNQQLAQQPFTAS